jgi:glycerophosphoryl diester phosphodiesterase
VSAAHAAGLRINTWTANDPALIARLVALGVDGIASDFPERVPKV